MIPNFPHCPRCGSHRVIRFGFVAGRQRWRCKRWRYQFTRLEGHGTPEPTRRAAVSLYGYGLSFNAVAHLLGTTAPSVLRWVCRSVDRCCVKPAPSDAVGIELDEMWHFLPRKDNKVWIWKASHDGVLCQVSHFIRSCHSIDHNHPPRSASQQTGACRTSIGVSCSC
jgi:transposase